METEEAVEETTLQCRTSKWKRGKISIMTPALLSSLDRTKTSNRDAAQIIAPIVHATGQNVEQYIVNRSSIRRYRQKHRISLSSMLKSELKGQMKPLVLHCDGKLMADLTGDKKVDRQLSYLDLVQNYSVFRSWDQKPVRPWLMH